MANGGKPWDRWWWLGRGSSRMARFVVRDKVLLQILKARDPDGEK